MADLLVSGAAIADVDVASIAAGDNNIGNVDIVTMPAVDTELPAAVALSDALANPTVPGVGAYLLGWDGTQWARVDVTATGKMEISGVVNATAAPTAPLSIAGAEETSAGGAYQSKGAGGATGIVATVPMLNIDGANNSTAWRWQRTPNVFKVQNVVAIATETTVWTPAAGKKFRLMGGDVAISSSGTLTLRDNTAGTVIAAVQLIANETVPLFGGNGGNGILSGAANRVLTATGPAGSSLIGTLFGTEE